MKQFTYSQKKWALTSCLILLLGFSLSIHQHREGAGVADMASEASVSGQIPTANGMVKVMYVKSQDASKTNVVVTEGKICESCEIQAFTLSTTFKPDDIDAMNVALLKYIKEDSTKEVAAKEVVKTKTPKKDEEEEETPSLSADEKVDKAFGALKEYCSGKDEGQEQLSCFAENFKSLLSGSPSSDILKLLKSDKITAKDLKKISEAKAAKFYKENIAKLVAEQVKEAKRISVIKLKAQLGDLNAREELESLDNDDHKQIRSDALDSLKEMIAGLPKGYSKVRTLITTTEKTLVYDDAKDWQESLNQALSGNIRSREELALVSAQTRMKQESLLNLMEQVRQVNSSGMSDALRAKYIGGEDVKVQSDFFNSYAKLVIDGMNVQGQNFVIPTPEGNPGINLAALGRVALQGGVSTFANDDNFVLRTTPGISGSAAVPLTAAQIQQINANRASLGLPTR